MANQKGSGRLDLYVVEDFEVEGEKKSQWSRVGVAFPHKQRGGFNIELRAFPRDGRLVALPAKDDDKENDGVGED